MYILLGGRDFCDRTSEDANYNDDIVLDYDDIESSDTKQSESSSEGEEHWDVDIEVIKDLESDDRSEFQSSVTHHGILHIVLLFLSVWASFYGISARALDHLITFLHHMFSTLVTASVASLATLFPSSLYQVQKYFGLQTDKFEKYVICGKCGSLYCYNECLETSHNGSSQTPKLCKHIEYRYHPFESRRIYVVKNS